MEASLAGLAGLTAPRRREAALGALKEDQLDARSDGVAGDGLEPDP
jgi:hypothetical protein